MPLRLPEVWTPLQRRGILFVVVILLAYLSIRFTLNPVRVSDPPPSEGARFNELQDRLDPNSADAAALAAIPNLGEKRADEIVAYREDFLKHNSGQRAFTQMRDLLKLKGIGVATTQSLGPYLEFPAGQGEK